MIMFWFWIIHVEPEEFLFLTWNHLMSRTF